MNQQYEVFISYSRRDDAVAGDTPPGTGGFITALRDYILRDHRRFSTEPLRIFFDQTDIRDLEDWRHRILAGLRSSKVLVVCLSPNYLDSRYCKWEWNEYVQRQVHQLAGSDNIAVVYCQDVPNAEDGARAAWLNDIMRSNVTDLRASFAKGALALERQDVRLRLAKMSESLWERVRRARRSLAVPGNVRRMNPRFVGRREKLLELHEHVGTGAAGVVTALHGLGGQGKSELAIAYANTWADRYSGGLWLLRAEGKEDLLSLIGELGFVPDLGLTPTPEQKANPALLGRAVITALRQRADRAEEEHRGSGTDHAEPAAALLILDNVDKAGLLSAAQLADIPRDDRVRLLATTRLGRTQLGGNRHALVLVAVDSLSEDDAVALVREHQPPRGPDGALPAFASPDEEAAAREIVRDLGCFTLAVEQVAVHLGLHAEVTARSFLIGLRARGLTRTDHIVGELRKKNREGEILHRDKQFRIVLDATLASLGVAAPGPTRGMSLNAWIRAQRENAPARTALEHAARLPPDVVPWPWLKALTLDRHPDLGSFAEDEPDPWEEIRRQLEGLRLLTPGDRPEHGRLHRLTAAYLRDNAATDGPLGDTWAAAQEILLRDYLRGRVDALCQSSAPPADWELDALMEALPLILKRGKIRHAGQGLHPLANAILRFVPRVTAYRNASAADAILAASRAVTEDVARLNPQDAQSQLENARAIGLQGERAESRGRLSEAHVLYTKASQLLQHLAAGNPEDVDIQRNLSVSFEKLGDLAKSRSDFEQASEHYQKALLISERLARTNPEDFYLEELAESHGKVGDVALASGHPDWCRHSYETALRIQRDRVRQKPRDPGRLRGLSVAAGRLARLWFEQGQLEDAKQYNDEGLRLSDRLARNDPANRQRQDDLAAAYLLGGELGEAQGRLVDASRYYEKCIALWRRLAQGDPENPFWQHRLLTSLTMTARLERSRQRYQKARERYEEALAVTQRLMDDDAGSHRLAAAAFDLLQELAGLPES